MAKSNFFMTKESEIEISLRHSPLLLSLSHSLSLSLNVLSLPVPLPLSSALFPLSSLNPLPLTHALFLSFLSQTILCIHSHTHTHTRALTHTHNTRYIAFILPSYIKPPSRRFSVHIARHLRPNRLLCTTPCEDLWLPALPETFTTSLSLSLSLFSVSTILSPSLTPLAAIGQAI